MPGKRYTPNIDSLASGEPSSWLSGERRGICTWVQNDSDTCSSPASARKKFFLPIYIYYDCFPLPGDKRIFQKYKPYKPIFYPLVQFIFYVSK